MGYEREYGVTTILQFGIAKMPCFSALNMRWRVIVLWPLPPEYYYTPTHIQCRKARHFGDTKLQYRGYTIFPFVAHLRVRTLSPETVASNPKPPPHSQLKPTLPS